MNRLEAIRALRSGDVLENDFVGIESVHNRLHTYTITLMSNIAIIQSNVMTNKYGQLITYQVKLTGMQVLAYIRRHYPLSRSITNAV